MKLLAACGLFLVVAQAQMIEAWIEPGVTLAQAHAAGHPEVLAWTQPAGPSTSAQFEVAVLKHNGPMTSSPSQFRNMPNGLSASNVALVRLIQLAYEVPVNQIAALPVWVMDESYDLETRCPPDTTVEDRRLMLRRLLEDQLKLSVVIDTALQKGYSLVVEKALLEKTGVEGSRYLAPTVQQVGLGTQKFINVPMSYLAYYLSNQLDDAVVDNTGLEGSYDFTLHWTSGKMMIRHLGHDEVMTIENDGPMLFEAVRAVGLRLVATKVPVRYVRLKHIEKVPAGN